MNVDEDIEARLRAGVATFMGHELFVAKGVLVPRRVSEVLVRATQALLDRDGAHRFVDMGCGSGNVGVALGHTFPKARVVSCDLSRTAASLAARNAARHELSARMEVRVGDLFGALEGLGLEGSIDVVACSPPFISSGRLGRDRACLLAHEPREAFDAGPYGIALHQRLAKESPRYLRPGAGWLIVEFGEGQAPQVERLLARAGGYDDVRPFADPSGIVVCLAARRAA